MGRLRGLRPAWPQQAHIGMTLRLGMCHLEYILEIQRLSLRGHPNSEVIATWVSCSFSGFQFAVT